MLDRIIYLIKQDIDKQCELRVDCDDDCPYKGDYDVPCYCKNVKEFDWNNYLLKKVASTNNWISVKDRLPKKWGRYLTSDHEGNIHIFVFHPNNIYPFGISPNDRRFYMPTHWQPLPEPPKGE